ncbi:hypothetical protein TrVGV298_002684 [Trichoderma virens]|nr:hypothetical protein TrVGV298_002684 [Trichoderma virens]
MLGASFFFKRGEGDRGSMALFFSTIASQLVQKLPSIAPHIRAAIEANPDINDKSVKVQFDTLIAEPFGKMSAYTKIPTVVIVVDALDECDNVEHVKLVIHLLSLAKYFTSVRPKFFVTSRPELAIRLGFENISGNYEDLVLHQIPPAIIEQDINSFLQDEFALIRQDYNKSVSSYRQLPLSWPGTEKVEKLVSMSVPLFIFAATACRFIQDRRVGGPKAQLAKILEHQSSQNTSLDATYLPIVDGLVAGLADSDKSKVFERFREIVGSIVNLASPLSTPSLARLLSISSDVIEDQLDLLHSVLYIPPDRNIPVRLLHLSFRDFLVEPEKGKDPKRYQFWVHEQKAHQLLAIKCLQLLLTDGTLKRNICNLQLPSTPRSEIDQQAIDAALPPEVQYACRYWVYHWKEGTKKIKDGELVDLFLSDHLLHWLEALALLGRISECIRMVHDLLGLLDREHSGLVSALLRDARRVILGHRFIIDISPLQIYYSAIVFAPQKSIVKKRFSNEIPAWLSQLSGISSEWDACLQIHEVHVTPAAIAFSKDSKILVLALSNGTIKLWDTVTGTHISTLEGHDSKIRSIAISHDSTLLISISRDVIKIWDTTTNSCIKVIEDKTIQTKALVVLSHDSKLLGSASKDKPGYVIKLWDTATYTCVMELKGHESNITSMAFSQDSKVLASVSSRGTIKCYDTVTSSYISTLERRIETHSTALFSHDLKTLATESRMDIKLWNVATGTCIATLEGHSDDITSLAFSCDSRMLASTSIDSDIRLWDITKKSSIAVFQGNSLWVVDFAFSHDSKLLASIDSDTMKIWDLEIDVGHIQYPGLTDLTGFVDNGKILISTSNNRTFKLWDVSTGTFTAALEGYSSRHGSIAVSYNSKMFAAASVDSRIQLWDIKTSTRIANLKGFTKGIPSEISAIAFSHNSQLLASATSANGNIKLWDIRTETCIKILEGHSAAFSHDSTIFASVSGNGTGIKLWDTSTGTCISTLSGLGIVMSGAFSHDSALFAAISYVNPISGTADLKLWDVSTGRCAASAVISENASYYVTFNATGSSISTAGGDFIVKYEPSPPATTVLLGAPDSLETEPCESTSVPSNNVQLHRRGIGLSEDSSWVMWNDDRIIWLPPAYRPGEASVKGSTLAIQCGRIVFLTVLPNLMNLI